MLIRPPVSSVIQCVNVDGQRTLCDRARPLYTPFSYSAIADPMLSAPVQHISQGARSESSGGENAAILIRARLRMSAAEYCGLPLMVRRSAKVDPVRRAHGRH